MANFQVFRETSLPATLEAYSLYFIAPAAKPDYVEIYVTGSSPATVKRVIDEDDIQALIDSAIAASGGVDVVADIAARDALSPTSNVIVLVLDASADATVDSGAATYAYQVSNTTWTKISEAESLDVILDWANLQNGPTSTVADIDDAVSKRHTHANKTELDKIGEDGSGNFTYNGALPVIAWTSIGW